jgi:hypothetical protein
MSTGSASVSVTIPITSANDPNSAGRGIAVEALRQAAEAIGAGGATSGSLFYNTQTGPGAAVNTVIGSWTFTAGT